MTVAVSGRSRFRPVGELSLHVRTDEVLAGAASSEGKSSPTFVYLNSLGSDLRIWDGVVASLPGRHLRFDARGHGLSDAPAGPYTIEQMASDLHRLLELEQADSVFLVGISVGGLIALRAALDRPERLRALVICDSAARIGSEAYWNERIATVEGSGLAPVSHGVVTRWFSPGFEGRDGASFAGYRNMLERTPVHGYAATCAALRDEDLRGRTAQIGLPALVICGSDDQSTPPQLSRELAESLPDGRYREIAGTGHLPCIEKPDEVAHAIAEFVGGLGRG